MKIVIVLACLMALAAAVDQSETVIEDADLNVAEHRRHGYRGYGHGGYGHGGYRGHGGWGGYHRGGWGRKRRSTAEEDSQTKAFLTDLETAEHRRSGWGHRGGYYGGWGHRGGFGYGGYGGYGYYG